MPAKPTSTATAPSEPGPQAPGAAGSPGLEPEWLDRSGVDLATRRRALADLRRVNGVLLGRRAMLRAVADELDAAPAGRSPDAGPRRRLLLDVAAGSGDIGAAVARAARRRGLDLGVVALDRELSHLVIGREWGDVRLAVVASASALPFADGAFELALSSLFFHHLEDAGARSRVAAAMLRVSRRGAVIVDLLPSRWALAALGVLFPLLGMSPIAREDGATSIRRGWTITRWRAFLAGGEARVRRRFPARAVVVLRRLPPR